MRLNAPIMLGLVLIAVSLGYTAYSNAILVQDTTPPIINNVAPHSGATYAPSTNTMWTVTCDCYDPNEAGTPNNGIKSVTMTIDGTLYNLNAPAAGYTVWSLAIPDPTIGSHTLTTVVTNNAGLTTTDSGSFSIYVALSGQWYINGQAIVSSTQTVYSTSTTVNFTFVVANGVPIAVNVKENGATILSLVKNGATWSGQYSFTNGVHNLALTTWDGIATVTMATVGLNFGSAPVPGFGWLTLGNIMLVGGAFFIGYGLLIQRKKTT